MCSESDHLPYEHEGQTLARASLFALLVHQVAMDLRLPDFKSLPGQQIYYLYGFAALLLLLLLAVFRALSGPSKQAGAARKIKGTSNVLFVGPMASGKTSLFGRVGPLSLGRHGRLLLICGPATLARV